MAVFNENTTIKEKLLDELIYLASDVSKENEAQQKLYKLLLDDTNEGKLYKYRSCNTRNLSLIDSQVLYCAKASEFNDPFDCKIGVDYQTVQEALYKKEFHMIKDLCDKFCSIEAGSSVLSDYSENDQKGILALQNSEIIKQLRTDSTNLSEKDFIDYFSTHSEKLAALTTELIIAAGIQEKVPLTSAQLRSMLTGLPKDGISFIAKGSTDVTGFLRAIGIKDDTDQIGLIRRLADSSQNESFKVASVQMDEALSEMESKTQKKLNDKFYIGSLAADNKNRLMWAHYADNHAGFCVEYDYSKAPKGTLPMPVLYKRQRPKISWDIAFDPSSDNLKKTSFIFMKSLLTKDAVWSYEQEWRILVSTAMDRMVKMPPISCIYLGARCSEENKKLIKIIAERRSIPVKQMILDRGEYDLHVKDN